MYRKDQPRVGGLEFYGDIDEINDEQELNQQTTNDSIINNQLFQQGLTFGQKLAGEELNRQFDAYKQQILNEQIQRVNDNSQKEIDTQNQLNNWISQLNNRTHRYHLLDRPLPCQSESDNVLQCYNNNVNDVLQCRNMVDQYSQCATNAQIQALNTVIQKSTKQ